MNLDLTDEETAALLRELVSDGRHEYLASLPSPVEARSLPAFDKLLGHNQVTDAYLLNLARRHKAVLLTFDVRLKEMARSIGEVEILV